MRAPLITVIIPTYNRALWLAESIRSVLNQTFTNFSLVVSDNASTDETPGLVNNFSDPRLKYLRLRKNVGLHSNHNLRLADVETDYVLIIPDDDVMHPELLQKTLAILEAHPNAGMVHTAFDIIDSPGNLVAAGVNWTYGLAADAVEPGMAFIRESMKWSCRVCASTSLMRTAALPPGFFDCADFPGIDMGLWLRMALEWEMAYLHRSLGTYRIHAASQSAAFGGPMEAGYVQETDIVQRLWMSKLSFLRLHADRLNDVSALRANADWGRRHELLLLARNSTVPERRFGETAKTVITTARIDPRMLLERDVWRLAAASALGRRAVERIQRATVARRGA
jgi:glycosyltransferase involved in cell wall biosynthesis